MKSAAAKSLALLAAAVVLALPAHDAAAKLSPKLEQLYFKLKHLPNFATPLRVVKKCVLPLVRYDPADAGKYYVIGRAKLVYQGGSGGSDARRLAGAVIDVVKRSSRLMPDQRRRIVHILKSQPIMTDGGGGPYLY